MTNLTQKLVTGGAALVVGLVVGWAVRGVASYNTATQSSTTYDGWTVQCPPANAKEARCQMVQGILDSRTQQPLARVAVGKGNDGKPAMEVMVPSGVALQVGIGIQFDKDPLRTEKFQTCTPDGCVALIAVDDKLQQSLNAGKDGRLMFALASDDSKPLAINLSLKGYDAAKRAYESSEAKRSSWFWRMWS